MHFLDGRGFTSLDDLANHCLTVLYQEMCAQNINQRVKGSYSETRVEVRVVLVSSNSLVVIISRRSRSNTVFMVIIRYAFKFVEVEEGKVLKKTKTLS